MRAVWQSLNDAPGSVGSMRGTERKVELELEGEGRGTSVVSGLDACDGVSAVSTEAGLEGGGGMGGEVDGTREVKRCKAFGSCLSAGGAGKD